MRRKKGQIALFVMVSLFIIGMIFLIYYFVNLPTSVPSKLRPLDDQLKSCIQSASEKGIFLMGEQGGYINLPGFDKGSEAYPSTSQMNFFGSTMPFWFYVSGNGQVRTQVPSITGMGGQLADYISESLDSCDFSALEAQGYSITADQSPKTAVTISDTSISIQCEWPVTLSLGTVKKRVTTHSITVNSNLGKMYKTAKEIFDNENSIFFLENYALDAITLNAPTTDVSLSCAPKIWSKSAVIGDIKNAIAANMQTIKFSGTYYTLRSSDRQYFVQSLGKPLTDQQASVFYDPSFPTAISVDPSDNDIMRADPVGLMEGMETIGFCYVPHHFVYSMTYPVIIRIFDNKNNLFQYPMIVQIKNNQPRNSTSAEETTTTASQVCAYKVQDFEVRTVDSLGNPLDSDVSLKCGGALCLIGHADNGVLNSKFPQCVNGFIVAKKDGYATAKIQASTDVSGSVEIPMSKIYNLNLKVVANARDTLKENDSALLTFTSPDYYTSAYYPSQSSISLPRGDYEIQGYLFRQGNIELLSQTTQKCTSVPRSGIAGLLGFQTDQCYDISTPTQQLTQITVGGGKLSGSISEEQLRQSKEMDISMPAQAAPTTMQELQDIYTAIGQNDLTLTLK